ncbi:hypothetical protein ACFQDN_22930 [Pseudomonas asuensis]|uniref:hypothetical protein n=1 Tax=Pseudomonas asuensis TaxID=1825787 RepID=UPI0016659BE9|nr:hypothetical protein [Pseudomonas asuensis]
MLGINRTPSMDNRAWWDNPAPVQDAANRTTGGFAQASAHQDQGHASSVAQQLASHLPPNRPGQHMSQYSSTQAYLTAVHGAQFGTSASASTRPLSQQEINTRGAQLVDHAQANMQHGQLVLTGSQTSERGQLHYQGHYQPTEAMNVAGTNFSDFVPGQAP